MFECDKRHEKIHRIEILPKGLCRAAETLISEQYRRRPKLLYRAQEILSVESSWLYSSCPAVCEEVWSNQSSNTCNTVRIQALRCVFIDSMNSFRESIYDLQDNWTWSNLSIQYSWWLGDVQHYTNHQGDKTGRLMLYEEFMHGLTKFAIVAINYRLQ